MPAETEAAPAPDLRRLVAPMPDRDLQVNEWRAAAGENVAIIGRNAVGKTSPMEAMLGVPLGRWQRRAVLGRQLGDQLQRASCSSTSLLPASTRGSRRTRNLFEPPEFQQ